ncbi:alpha/beta fold hydrolase [Aquihabitans sp. McL0605]|uniref:alpha/beta fold hydrolase n=1 Tax=Aquihabitans sp. McL0605 TaxID=3415671 RepID=UPI003CF5771E
MACFVVLPGAGGRGSDWWLVQGELEALGHELVGVDLPCDQPVGLEAYVDAAVAAIGDRRDDLAVVGHSLGGLIAPLVADRVPVGLLAFVTAMVPLPGETGGEWWGDVGQGEAMAAQHLPDGSDETVFLHDVPAEVLAQTEPPRGQTDTLFADPCPLETWPTVPTTFLLCRDDRFFPAEWMADVVRNRLGIEPTEIPGGHCPYLSQPKALAAALDHAWRTRSDLPPVALGELGS